MLGPLIFTQLAGLRWPQRSPQGLHCRGAALVNLKRGGIYGCSSIHPRKRSHNFWQPPISSNVHVSYFFLLPHGATTKFVGKLPSFRWFHLIWRWEKHFTSTAYELSISKQGLTNTVYWSYSSFMLISFNPTWLIIFAYNKHSTTSNMLWIIASVTLQLINN